MEGTIRRSAGLGLSKNIFALSTRMGPVISWLGDIAASATRWDSAPHHHQLRACPVLPSCSLPHHEVLSGASSDTCNKAGPVRVRIALAVKQTEPAKLELGLWQEMQPGRQGRGLLLVTSCQAWLLSGNMFSVHRASAEGSVGRLCLSSFVTLRGAGWGVEGIASSLSRGRGRFALCHPVAPPA